VTDMRLRAPLHSVSPRARWYWATRALLGWAMLLVVEGLAWAGNRDSGPALVSLVAVTSVLAAAHLAVMPQWRYRVHRWEATEVAVYTQSGWFTQERRIAPVNRIQTVDTHRGPIEQLFGLANVTVTTASAAGPLHIRGLAAPTADSLVDELTNRTHHVGDGT
jgi:uncharacterized protein